MDKLHKFTNSIVVFFDKWKLNVNADKSELIIFTRKIFNHPERKREAAIPDFIVRDKIIEPKLVANYLGVLLHQKSIFNEHVARPLKKAHKILGILYCLMCRKSKLSINNKLLLYKMIIRPVLLYAAPVWSSASDSTISRLQRFQNKVWRMITNASLRDRNINLRKKFNLPLISDHIFRITKNSHDNRMTLEELQEAKPISEEEMPFKMKFRMPYHLLIDKFTASAY